MDLGTEKGNVGPGEGTIVGRYVYLFWMRRIYIESRRSSWKDDGKGIFLANDLMSSSCK